MGRAEKILSDAARLLEPWYDKKANKTRFPTAIQRKKGYAILVTLAEEGHTDAQLKIGQCLLDGNGIAKDKKSGSAWIERAAEQGYSEAQYWIARYYVELYTEGEDRREQNLILANKWARAALENGFPGILMGGLPEQCTLAFQEKAEREFNETRIAAEAGDAFAQRSMWIKYLGGCGVKRDAEKAAFWLAKFEKQKERLKRDLLRRAKAGDGDAREQYEALGVESALPPFEPTNRSRAKKTRTARSAALSKQKKKKPSRLKSKR